MLIFNDFFNNVATHIILEINRIAKLLMTSTLVIIFAGCSDFVNIKSSSTVFLGEKLGQPISSKGILNEERGSCTLIKDNGAHAYCDPRTKIVNKISIYCENNKVALADKETNVLPSIDSVNCNSSTQQVETFSKYKKLCNDLTFDNVYYMRSDNAFFLINKTSRLVVEMGLVSDDKYLDDSVDSKYTNAACTEVAKQRIIDEEVRLKNESNNKNFLVGLCTVGKPELLKYECNVDLATLSSEFVIGFTLFEEQTMTALSIFGKKCTDGPMPSACSNLKHSAPVEYEILGNGSVRHILYAKGCRISRIYKMENDELFEIYDGTPSGNCAQEQILATEMLKPQGRKRLYYSKIK